MSSFMSSKIHTPNYTDAQHLNEGLRALKKKYGGSWNNCLHEKVRKCFKTERDLLKGQRSQLEEVVLVGKGRGEQRSQGSEGFSQVDI